MMYRLGRQCNELPLRSLLTYPPNQINILSARNMDPLVATTNTSGGLNTETPAGRKTFTVDEYIERCIEEEPHAVISMADEVNHNTSKKKTRKAFDTTEKWFTKLVGNTRINWDKCFLFAVVTGIGSETDIYIRGLTENMLKQGAKGIYDAEIMYIDYY